MSHRYPALKCSQNNKDFYIAILPNNVLKEICFVSRREEDPLKGFQRSLNESRAKDIAKYLDELDGVIPSALILSAQENVRFSFNKNEIAFVEQKNGFMVLDGQHRLFGLIKAEKKHEIPVVIFKGLNTSEEVNLFIDINTTQKGVPTTLLIDIKNLAGSETKKEEKQRIVFDRLNENSVLTGLLSPNKSRVGRITRVAFNSATSDIFENGLLKGKNAETIYKCLKNYFEAVDQIFTKSKSEKAKLTNTTFFKASLAIFSEVTEKTLKRSNDLKVESLVIVLEPISKINFDSYTGSNNATYQKVLSDMRAELNDYMREFDSQISDSIF